ncbi:MAG TPA: SAM-dependent methyltransferase [Burkholderiaceae bacterium]|nr:SAM-dependent methyltransferase [Burkholderiaceae bacterium]
MNTPGPAPANAPPGYRTKQDLVAIRGIDALLICSLLDRQQHADPLGEAEALGISSAAWPLFGQLWASSLQLAALMGERPLVAHERVLEVGCGLALASLVSHRRGVDVTASDCHPLAATFLLENLRLNALPPLPYRHGHWSAAPLLAVGVETPLRAAVPDRPIVEGLFGLIIGSDVLYERDDAGVLSAFIDRHANPDAQVLIVDPDRGNRAAFNRRMAAAGFVLEQTTLGGGAVGVGAYRGRLLSYRRGVGMGVLRA